MKTIAFDVKGTLDGHKGAAVLAILKHFKAAGWKVTVWSSVYSYAADFVNDNALVDVEAESKFSTGDAELWNRELFDICVDDCYMSAEWLGAKKVVMVQDIPTDTPISFAKDLINEANKTE